MASADPAVTASPSSHVGIASVRRDATRRTDTRSPRSSEDSYAAMPIHLEVNLSHLEDVDGEAFQVCLSVSSSEPPTHLLLRSKSLISRRSDDQRRKHPLCLRWTSNCYGTTKNSRSRPRVSLLISRCRVHVNTHTLHAATRSRHDFLSVALPLLLRSPARRNERERSAFLSPEVEGIPREAAIPKSVRTTTGAGWRCARARRSFLRENAVKRAGNCVSDAAR